MHSDMPPLWVLLYHCVCSSPTVCAPQISWFEYTWRAPSDNTINDVHEHPEACDWVSKVEIGLIGQDLSCIGGYLVGLWVVILHPHFLRGEFPLTPPQVLHYILL